MHRVRDELRAGLIGPLSTIMLHHGGPRAMLFRNGTHMIDAICFFAESEPAQVFARLEEGFEHWDRYRGDGGKLPENDPSATGLIMFENGVSAVYSGSKETSVASHWIRLMGPGGEVSFNMDVHGPAVVTRHGEDGGEPATHELHPSQYRVQGLPAAYTELIDVIENGGVGVSTATEARKTLRIMLGFLQSQQEGGRLVDVPG